MGSIWVVLTDLRHFREADHDPTVDKSCLADQFANINLVTRLFLLLGKFSESFLDVAQNLGRRLGTKIAVLVLASEHILDHRNVFFGRF
jgi:hypothetical protein